GVWGGGARGGGVGGGWGWWVGAEGGGGVHRVGVLPRPAAQRVIAAAAGEGVVARAAVDVRAGQGAVGLVQREVVIAGAAIEEDQARIGDGRRPALDGDGAVIDEDGPGRVAGDHDRAVL